MTTLILAHRKFISLPVFNPIARWVQRLRQWNRRGVVSFILIVTLGVGLSFYLGALYHTFQVGFAMRENLQAVEATRKTVSKLELAMQTRRTAFGGERGAVIQAMEKISVIRYLPSDGDAVAIRAGERAGLPR